MALFQQSVLKKYVANIDKTQLQNSWQFYKHHFFNAEIQQNIRNSKEEEYQEGFVRDLFVKVLGYTLNPQPNYNFVLEKKTVTDATKSDGAIVLNGDVIGVVELKDTGTPDLDKVSNQAFGYKHKNKNCIYVITSNFEKLRFYINDATDFEEFELFTLTQERFTVLYLCLQQQNIINDLPLKIKQQSVVQEENVTKKLYDDYSSFKRKLFQNIAEQNPQHDKLLLFKKTQKLLDRFLFIFFAEDKSLLPPNSVREILKQWEQLKELDNYIPLYDRFKKYFGYLNVGHVGKQHEIFAYNGGLFLPDEVLDSITVDDTILYNGADKLSSYDYETEVDVNILGHIFEHSLTEIEELQLELEGKPVEKSKTKRKKEGVFYTPRYITKYIVENTVGALCTQKKEELQINEETFAPQKRKANRKALLDKIETYRNWLLQLTICDPACGSGAFLNAALEYLKAEHKTADELTARMLDVPIIFSDLDNSILENNLFGVDINEDAIEIAKLSLWLHTAKKGRKLSNLSNNIKCGNSLIDDTAVAGEKAFSWQKEFPHVFTEKDKKAFHVTTASHDSRTSDRMIKYKVREKRDNGTRPKADAVWLDNDEEILITEVVTEIVKEDGLNVLAYNICGDHMHIVLVCEEEEVAPIMQKIKSKTARAVNIKRGVTVIREHAPLSKENTSLSKENVPLSKAKDGETHHSLWTQKFGCKEITDDAQLRNTIEYVRTNREKHGLPDLHQQGNPSAIGKGSSPSQQENPSEIEQGSPPSSRQGSMLPCSTSLSPCLYQNYEDVFRREHSGGFDVVIGNPPYVFGGNEGITKNEKNFFSKQYITGGGKVNLFTIFIEKGYQLLKNNGQFSFIIPNTFLRVTSYHESRKFFLTNFSVREIADLGNEVFNKVVTTAIILVASKKTSLPRDVVRIIKNFKDDATRVNLSDLIANDFVITTNISDSGNFLMKKIISDSTLLGEECKEMIFGIVITKNKEEVVSEIQMNGYKPFLEGRDITSYFIRPIHQYLNYKPSLLHRARTKEVFEVPEKLLVQRITGGRTPLKVAYDNQQFYNKESINNIILKHDSKFNIKFILAVLNSTLINWFYNNQFTNESTLTVNISKEYLSRIPIKSISVNQQQPFIDKADIMLLKNKELNELSQSFTQFLQAKFAAININNKLQHWHSLTGTDLFKELVKQKIKLSLSEQQEWLEYFEEQKTKANSIQQVINQTDKEIDAIVYQLYNLTDEEIKIVEAK